MSILKEFLSFISNMRKLWEQLKEFTIQNKPTGAQMTSFLEQQADPSMRQALNERPEWQAAKRATADNQGELRDIAYQSAQNIPVLQGKSKEEMEKYVTGIASDTGFI